MSNSKETTYSISELAEAAGVTPRTIRYYTSEGLLPPPDTHGKYARYTAAHLSRLRLIARLKEAYLPLNEIRVRLEGLTPAQVEAGLADPSGERRIAEVSSAGDYIAGILAQQPEASRSERDTIARSRAEVPEPRPQYAPAMSQPNQAVAPAPQAPSGPRGLLSRLVPQRRGVAQVQAAQPEPPAETWQRHILAAGVELHIREPLNQETHARVQQLLERARDLFR